MLRMDAAVQGNDYREGKAKRPNDRHGHFLRERPFVRLSLIGGLWILLDWNTENDLRSPAGRTLNVQRTIDRVQGVTDGKQSIGT